jgi:hypothetical protein
MFLLSLVEQCAGTLRIHIRLDSALWFHFSLILAQFLQISAQNHVPVKQQPKFARIFTRTFNSTQEGITTEIHSPENTF